MIQIAFTNRQNSRLISHTGKTVKVSNTLLFHYSQQDFCCTQAKQSKDRKIWYLEQQYFNLLKPYA